jgi:hypothetical protein
MEAKALLPGVTEKRLQVLVASGDIKATKQGRGVSLANATFCNDSVIDFALRNGLWLQQARQ